MATDNFMLAVTVLVISAIPAGYVLRRIARRYPGTAFAGFASPQEIGLYFGFAKGFLRQNRWLVLISVLLPLSNYFIQVWGWLILRSSLAGAPLHTLPISVTRMRAPLVDALLSLAAGFRTYGNSLAVAVAIVVAVFMQTRSLRLLRRISECEDCEGLTFVKRWMTICQSLILLAGIPLAAALILRVTAFAVPFGYVFLTALGLTANLGVSLGEAAIMFYVRSSARGEAIGRAGAFRRAVAVVRPLFYWNMLLVAVAGWGSYIMLPSSIMMLAGAEVPDLPRWLLPVTWHGRLVSGVAIALLACGAFRVAITEAGPTGFRGLLRANFDFVGRHFVKYLTIVAVGTALLFIPGLVRVLLEAWIPSVTVPDYIAGILMHAFLLYLALLFSLVAFRFYCQYAGAMDRPEPPIPEPAAPGAAGPGTSA